MISSGGCVISISPLEEFVVPENIWRVSVPFSSTRLCSNMSSRGCNSQVFPSEEFIASPNPWRVLFLFL